MDSSDASDRERGRPIGGRERIAQEALNRSMRTNLDEDEELMNEIRQANEDLILAAIHVEDELGPAENANGQAREELDGLTGRIRGVTKRLSKAVADAHARGVLERSAPLEPRAEELPRRLLDIELSRRLLNVEEEERRQLARDIHDTTQQSLAALSMQLALVERGASGLDAVSRQALAESRSLAERCADEVRTLSHVLHPPMLHELGLPEALSRYLSGFKERSGIPANFDCDDFDRLPPAVETALFRIVQESLASALRHARSQSISISLRKSATDVTLQVRDRTRWERDDPRREGESQVQAESALPVRGMRERIDQLGGVFSTEFTSHEASVRVTVPLD